MVGHAKTSAAVGRRLVRRAVKGEGHMLQTRDMVRSLVMTTGYKPGIEVRQAIIRELARREVVGLAAPSLREWPDLLPTRGAGRPLHWTTVQTHLEILRTGGLIQGTGETVALTECGRSWQIVINP